MALRCASPPRQGRAPRTHPLRSRRELKQILIALASPLRRTAAQVLYPDHAVQGTVGSHFVRDLEVPNSSVVVRKGRRKHVDTHSAFFESDRCTSTGLLEVIHKLRRRRGGIGRMFMAGLGYDTIVRYTAEDALLLVAGLEQQHANGWSRVFVVEEATGFVTREGAAKAKMALEAMGVTVRAFA